MIVAVVFIILGVAIRYCKWYFLIAGYKTMSAEEKQKVNIEKVATLFRDVMFITAFILIAGDLILPWFEIPILLPISCWSYNPDWLNFPCS